MAKYFSFYYYFSFLSQSLFSGKILMVLILSRKQIFQVCPFQQNLIPFAVFPPLVGSGPLRAAASPLLTSGGGGLAGAGEYRTQIR